nr:MAG TPA: hypothetical protein [Caudoviricetes sp.]
MQRKKYSQEYKDQVIKEVLETENATTVARRYGLNAEEKIFSRI